jgi:hypothetical protein
MDGDEEVLALLFHWQMGEGADEQSPTRHPTKKNVIEFMMRMI